MQSFIYDYNLPDLIFNRPQILQDALQHANIDKHTLQ